MSNRRPEVTEEELTAEARSSEEEPTRVRPISAKTPLEQSLRELSPDEIKEHLVAQQEAEKKRQGRSKTHGRTQGQGSRRRTGDPRAAQQVRRAEAQEPAGARRPAVPTGTPPPARSVREEGRRRRHSAGASGPRRRGRRAPSSSRTARSPRARSSCPRW